MLHLVAGLVFFILSPGVLLTIPAGSRGLFASSQTSVLAAAVHSIVFVAAIYFLHSALNVEGFAAAVPKPKPGVPIYCDNTFNVDTRKPDCSSCVDKVKEMALRMKIPPEFITTRFNMECGAVCNVCSRKGGQVR